MLNLKPAPSDPNSAQALAPRRAPVFYDRWWQSGDGLRLYARDYPANAGRVRLPVICLHGLTRNSADFEEVAPYIAAMDRRVIVPDLRGRGLSENDPAATNYHLWTYARDVLDLCDAMGIGQAIFIGSSLGGLVTMVLSTLRPTLIHAAVLNDAGPVLSEQGLERLASFAALEQKPLRNWHDAATFLAEQNRHAFPAYSHDDWLAVARRVVRKGRDGFLHLAFDPRMMHAFRSMNVAQGGYDLEPCYDSLAAGRNLLVLRGALSDVLDAPAAKKMCKPAGVTHVEIADVGHAPTLTEDASRAAVMQFLESLK